MNPSYTPESSPIEESLLIIRAVGEAIPLLLVYAGVLMGIMTVIFCLTVFCVKRRSATAKPSVTCNRPECVDCTHCDCGGKDRDDDDC